jgi:phasin family protein
MNAQDPKSNDAATGANSDPFGLHKALGDLKIPGVDVSALLATQQKNLAALADANRQVVASVQQIAQRQAEHLRQAVTEAAQAAKSAATSPAAKDLATHSADLTRQALDKAVEHLKEVSEIAAKAQAQVADTVHKRVTASLDELRAMLKPK